LCAIYLQLDNLHQTWFTIGFDDSMLYCLL